MFEIGSFLCAVGLLCFISFMALFLIHRYTILKPLIRKKLSDLSWDDPDFNYNYYVKHWR